MVIIDIAWVVFAEIGGPDVIGRDCGNTIGRSMLPPAAAMSNTPVEQVGGGVRGLRYTQTPSGLFVTRVASDTPAEGSGLATGVLIRRITRVAYHQSIVPGWPRRRRRRGAERSAAR